MEWRCPYCGSDLVPYPAKHMDKHLGDNEMARKCMVDTCLYACYVGDTVVDGKVEAFEDHQKEKEKKD